MADLAQLARKWNRHADEMTMIAPCRSERLEADVMRRCAAELLVALSEAALSHAAGQEAVGARSRGVPEGMVQKAARYDWLRDQHNDRESVIAVTCDDCMIEDFYLHDDECLDLDAAIDSAIAAQRKEGE